MQPTTAERGRFLTLEGPDGAGKSHQALRLVTDLRAAGRVVTQTREPGGTPLGERIRDVLLATDYGARAPQTDVLLFNAARSELVREVIRPALARGEVVVCDRYADSTVAYQGYGSGLDIRRLRDLEALSTGGLRPDLVILLDVPVEIGLSRRWRGAAEEMTRFERSPAYGQAFHERVRDGYLELARADPDHWRIIDASLDPDAVAAAIAKAVSETVGQSEPNGASLRISV